MKHKLRGILAGILAAALLLTPALAAGTEHCGGLEDKLFLDFGKLHGFLRSPVFGKGFFFTEHSFSGAWSIQDDLVKEFGECFG